MKRLIFLFFLLPFLAQAQTQPPQDFGGKLYRFRNGVIFDSAVFLPRRDTTNADPTMLAPGMIQWRPADQRFYGRDSTQWGFFVTSKDSLFSFRDTTLSLSAWKLSYNGYHAAEGSVFPLNGDTLINIFRLDTAMQHAGGKGQIVKRYSYDNGKSWTVPVVVYDGPDDDRNVVAAKLDNNRIVVIFRRYTGGGTDTDVGRIYSDDFGTTWSSYVALPPFLTTVALSFGTIVKGGDLAWHAILHKPGQCAMYKTVDNGVNWTLQNNIFTTPATAGETSVAYVGSNRMIALTRDDAAIDSTYIQFTSSDNGDTWARVGRVNMNQDQLLNNRTAPFIMWDSARSIVIATSYYRNQLGASPYTPREDSLFFYINDPDDVFSDARAWDLKYRIPRPQPSQISTYGYPNICKLTNGDYFGVYSENGTLGDNDIFGGLERTYLTQFHLTYGSNDTLVPAGLNNQYNPLTGGIDHFSLLPAPDSLYQPPYVAAFRLGMYKNQTEHPFTIWTTLNSALFDVSTDGSVLSLGSYTSRGNSPSFVFDELDTNNGMSFLFNANQLFWNRKDGLQLMSTRISDGYTAFSGTVQSNSGQFISRSTAPMYRWVHSSLVDLDWRATTEIGDWQLQLMASDSNIIGNRAVIKSNGQWVMTVQPPVANVATDSVMFRGAGDGTLKASPSAAAFILNQTATTQTGGLNVQTARIGNTNSQLRIGELSAASAFIQATDPAGTANRNLAFLSNGNEIMRITSVGLGIALQTPTSPLHVRGRIADTLLTVTGNTTLASTHSTVIVNNTGSATITLPAAATCPGAAYHIKKISAAGNDVVIDGNGAETIDNVAGKTLTLQYSAVIVKSNGTAWFITASYTAAEIL